MTQIFGYRNTIPDHAVSTISHLILDKIYDDSQSKSESEDEDTNETDTEEDY